MNEHPALAYKVVTAVQRQAWLDKGVFDGAPVDLVDGYIHLSTADQLAGTLDKHFAGQCDLYLAAVDLAALGAAVRWEEARGGQLFPHVYGSLPLSAAIAMTPVERESDGSVRLPEAGSH